MKNTRGYNSAPKKCVLYSEEERVTGGHRGTDVTKQVKDTPNMRQSVRLQTHATRVYHTAESKRQAER